MWAVWAMMLMLHSTLHGCDSPTTPPQVKGNIADVIISGKTYHLEVAAEPAVRMKGLGGRTSIPEDGGMIFVFPPEQVQKMGFVMRDCPIDIDIIYLDGAGVVDSFYEMKALPPRDEKAGEGKPGEMNNANYERRLEKTAYSSKYRCTFAVELKDGSLKKLNIKEGDKVVFDRDALKKLAK